MFKIVIHERVECCSNRFNAFFPPLLLWNAWNHLLIAIDTSIVRDYFFFLWFRLHFFPCLKCLLFFSSPIAINFLQIHNNLKQSMRCDPIQCGRGGKETENILMVCQISQSEYAVRISLGIRIAYLSRWSIQMVNFSLPFIFFRTLCSSHCDFSHILHYFWHWFAGYYFIMLECKM